MNEVIKAIADRRSIRSYLDTPVTDEQLEILKQAAVQSPSAVNRQPYHFTFVRSKALLDAFKKDSGADIDILRGAPMVCFIFRNAEGIYPPIDAGIAVENLALAAHAIGLGSVILGMPRDVFIKNPEWLKTLKAPEGMVFAVAIGIGVPAASKEAHPVREGLIDVL